MNLTNTCGEKFDKDVNGDYIVQDKFATFFAGNLPFVAGHLCSVFGLYLGQIAFRSKGAGRLGPEAFESESPVKQIAFATCMMLLTQAPGKFEKTFTTSDASLVFTTIVLHILPCFVCFFIASYTLPMISQLLMNYPVCFYKEIVDLRTHDDIERVLNMKPTDVIRQQLNGKLIS